MSVPFYGHSGGKYTDALATIKQHIAANGTTLSAIITKAAGGTIYPAVLTTSQRNITIASFSDGLEMIIHEVNLVQREDTLDGRTKNVPQFRFSLAAYGVFDSPQLDLTIQVLSEEYQNAPQLEATYQSYSDYAAAIGDTTNSDPGNFVRARTYTMLCGTTSITGPASSDIFTKTDLLSLVLQSQLDTMLLLNTDSRIYSDGKPAGPDPKGTGGWYYQNVNGEKINWYFTGVAPSSDVVTAASDITSMYLEFHPRTAGTRAPKVALFTRPLGDVNDGGEWFRSRMVYDIADTNWTQDVPEILHIGAEPAVAESFPRRAYQYSVADSLGPQDPSEEVFIVALLTDSAAATGAYDFAVNHLGYTSAQDGTVRYTLIGVAEPVTGGGGGGGAVDSVNGLTGTVVLTADNIDDSLSSHQFVTAAQKVLIDAAIQPGDNVSTLTNDAGYLTAGDNVSDLTNDAGYLTSVTVPVAATVTVGTLATLNTTTTNLAGLLGDDNPVNYVKVDGTYAIESGSVGVSMTVNGEITFGSTCKATVNASVQLQKDPLAGTSSDRYGLCFFLNGAPIGNPSTINIEDLTKPVQASLAYSGSFTSGDVLTIRIAQKAGSSADNPLVQRMAISLFGL